MSPGADPAPSCGPPQRKAGGLLQGPPARILAPSKAPHFNEKGLLSSPVERKNHYQENPNQLSQLLQHIYCPTSGSAGRADAGGGRAANRVLDALFYQNSDKSNLG